MRTNSGVPYARARWQYKRVVSFSFSHSLLLARVRARKNLHRRARDLANCCEFVLMPSDDAISQFQPNCTTFQLVPFFFLPCCFIRCSLSHYHSFDVEIIYLSFIFSMLRRIYIELHISLFFCCEAQICCCYCCCFLLKTRITHKYRYYSASIGALFNALNPK